MTSYARARAESLGMDAKGGLAERADRLVLILVATGLSGLFDLPILIYVALWALALANTQTVAPARAEGTPPGARRGGRQIPGEQIPGA